MVGTARRFLFWNSSLFVLPPAQRQRHLESKSSKGVASRPNSELAQANMTFLKATSNPWVTLLSTTSCGTYVMMGNRREQMAKDVLKQECGTSAKEQEALIVIGLEQVKVTPRDQQVLNLQLS